MTAGSSCIANAYRNTHEPLAKKDIGIIGRLYLHTIDTIAIVHRRFYGRGRSSWR